MWKKTLLIFFSAAIIMAIAAMGISYFSKPVEEEIVQAEEKMETAFHTELTESDKALFAEDMLEHAMQNFIHVMSHQKVKADEKRGRILITEERLVLLLKALEKNESTWEHSDIYADILNRWYSGDFSQADKDHNAIWELSGGTTGKATGILSAAEEQEYLAGE